MLCCVIGLLLSLFFGATASDTVLKDCGDSRYCSSQVCSRQDHGMIVLAAERRFSYSIPAITADICVQ
jgi:hypothetical protein